MALVWLSVGSVTTTAIEQKPLPAFQVFTKDGRPVPSIELSGQERWLLIYAIPDCRPCDQLIRALKDWQTPQLVARTVLVIGAQTDMAQAYVQMSLRAEVSAISWYADAEGQAWQALGIQGTPLLIGIRRGRMEWAISGVLKDTGTLESAVRTWVEY